MPTAPRKRRESHDGSGNEEQSDDTAEFVGRRTDARWNPPLTAVDPDVESVRPARERKHDLPRIAAGALEREGIPVREVTRQLDARGARSAHPNAHAAVAIPFRIERRNHRTNDGRRRSAHAPGERIAQCRWPRREA